MRVEPAARARRAATGGTIMRLAHALEQRSLVGDRLGGNSCRPVSSSHRMIAGRVQVGAPVERLAARLLGRHVADLAVDDARARSSPASASTTPGRSRSASPRPSSDSSTLGGETSRCTSFRSLERCARRRGRGQLLARCGRRRRPGRRCPSARSGSTPRAGPCPRRSPSRGTARRLTCAGVEHRHQVAVRQPHDHLGLVAEARHVLLVGQVRQHGLDDAQLLHPRLAVQARIERAHAALRQRRQQVILAKGPRECLGGHRRRGWGQHRGTLTAVNRKDKISHFFVRRRSRARVATT